MLKYRSVNAMSFIGKLPQRSTKESRTGQYRCVVGKSQVQTTFAASSALVFLIWLNLQRGLQIIYILLQSLCKDLMRKISSPSAISHFMWHWTLVPGGETSC